MLALFFHPIGATVDLEKMLKNRVFLNESILAIRSADTAENEPSKV